ncbi:toprim domain-containing protein [Isoptericola sp. AK164]|uniref:toprim domain-containing protein n=1 Tax=Isoptericola sp. AK164 TaxID=3024246 RepID=UPI00241899E1|nr:toprim domain-containing protein [Isoptericola sp. AK164]
MTTTARVLAANAAAWDYWRWHAGQADAWVSDYLAARGLRGTVAGQAPAGWARLVPTLTKRGFTEAELLDAGLAVRAGNGSVGDAFRDRIMLPICDDAGQIIGFTARGNSASDDANEPPAEYLNTTSTAVYDKSRALYGLDAKTTQRLRRGATPVLVEGALDAEAVRRTGADLVPLAACGTAITTGHLEALRAIDPDSVGRLILATDADTAGQRATCRLVGLLTPDEVATVRVAELEPDTDPADLIQQGRRTDLRAALVHQARTLAEVAIDATLASYDLTSIEGSAALRHVTAAVASQNPATLAHATTHLTHRLAPVLDHDIVAGEMVDAITTSSSGDGK